MILTMSLGTRARITRVHRPVWPKAYRKLSALWGMPVQELSWQYSKNATRPIRLVDPSKGGGSFHMTTECAASVYFALPGASGASPPELQLLLSHPGDPAWLKNV